MNERHLKLDDEQYERLDGRVRGVMQTAKDVGFGRQSITSAALLSGFTGDRWLFGGFGGFPKARWFFRGSVGFSGAQ